ncbi:MAG: SagB/ThcOx family dehydrogenase [Syntrophales bacterium]|nr:SagB/ThcOx family dehydrogenase [Syntrophales bacterium]
MRRGKEMNNPTSSSRQTSRLKIAMVLFAGFLISLPLAGFARDGQGESDKYGRTSVMEETIISLPEATFRGIILEEALQQRRSVRKYSSREMTLSELGQLLFSGQGVTETIHGRQLRTAPSAGATYPMRLYAAVNNVEGLPNGIYLYAPASHSLKLVEQGDFGTPLMAACLGQEYLKTADAVLIITAIPERISHTYGDRSMFYIYMEAGHIAQNILLQAVSLGLGGVPVGAFQDRKVNTLLPIEAGKEQTIYLIPLGTL